MTIWDFAWRFVSSWPVMAVFGAFAVFAGGWAGLKLLGLWLTYRAQRENPEVALRASMKELLQMEISQVARYREELALLEKRHREDMAAMGRRYGRLLIMVRALEEALDQCSRNCPECRKFLEAAMERAKKEARQKGLMRADDTLTGVNGGFNASDT